MFLLSIGRWIEHLDVNFGKVFSWVYLGVVHVPCAVVVFCSSTSHTAGNSPNSSFSHDITISPMPLAELNLWEDPRAPANALIGGGSEGRGRAQSIAQHRLEPN